MTDLKKLVLEALSHGPATYPELRRRTGRHIKSLKWALCALALEGAVRREKIVYPRIRSRRREDIARKPRVRWHLTDMPRINREPWHPAQDMVLKTMVNGCTIQDLVATLNKSKKNVLVALRHLENRGLVRSERVDPDIAARRIDTVYIKSTGEVATLIGKIDKRKLPKYRWYKTV